MEGFIIGASTAPSSTLSMTTQGVRIQHARPRLRQPKKIKPTDRWDVVYQTQTGEEQCVVMLATEMWSAAHKWESKQQIAGLQD
eukprot:5329622-Pleurochrysis_carterae.AAC.1